VIVDSLNDREFSEKDGREICVVANLSNTKDGRSPAGEIARALAAPAKGGTPGGE